MSIKKRISAVLIAAFIVSASGSCSADPPSSSSLSEAASFETSAVISEPVTETATETSSEIFSTTAVISDLIDDEDEPDISTDIEAETQKDTTFTADEDHVKMIGRTLFRDGILWLEYSASGIEFSFNGTSASITLVGDDSINGEEKNLARFSVYINGERTMDELVDYAERTFTVFSSEGSSETDVKLLKLSEPSPSSFGIKRIDIDPAGVIRPIPEKELKIEFIGDSITCGYGIDDDIKEHHFSTATEDATKTYAYKTAEALDADYSLICYSGNGIISGYTNDPDKKNKTELLPPKYGKYKSITAANGTVVSGIDWDTEKFVPDIVVINLGTNDATFTHKESEKELEFEEEYVKFLYKIRETYSDAHIICTLGMISDELFGMIEAAVTYYTAASEDKNMSLLKFTPHDGSLGYAADWHPSEATNEVAAQLLIEHIRSLGLQ